MIALPIPDKRSPIRYGDLTWRGRNLGDVVAKLTRGKQQSDHRAHLDPDLRQDICRREPGWRPALGQDGIAQGHLRKQGVGAGDLFLFWGAFRAVDEDLRWRRRPEHYIWGWLQIGAVASVDEVVRRESESWRWAKAHPHWAMPPDPTNTLYVASERLSLPGARPLSVAGSGVFDFVHDSRHLTRQDAPSASRWALPVGFLPRGRPPLSYHASPDRWSQVGDRAHLLTVGRGQEFVLDLEHYPELNAWLVNLLAGGRG